MNKLEYLIKKGRIADPANGFMFVIYSNREGVTISKLPIWKIYKTGQRINIREEDGKILSDKIDMITYCFNETPWEVEYPVGEKSHLISGTGTGFGDLWGYSHIFTFDQDLANELFHKETLRVQEKYLSGKHDESDNKHICIG